jgi:hypothetical protein
MRRSTIFGLCHGNSEQTDAAAKLVAFNKAPSWDRRSLIEKGGWATFPGTDKPNSAVVSACAEKLGSST